MKRKVFFTLVILFGILGLLGTQSNADMNTRLFGKPLSLMGYVQQTASYGLESGNFDSKDGVQELLFQGLLEARYEPSRDVRIFLSGKLNADWAYPVFSSDSEWKAKGMDEGRDNLYIFDDAKDLLSEAHVTWTPGNFYVRMGKQVVAWGETDGFRLMDQINPQDTRRGMGDVQFENTIIPIWLANVEYNTLVDSTWLQELGVQVVFNPNLEFRGNERIEPGNEKFGIWAANLEEPLGGPFPPFDYAHIGSWDDTNIKDLDDTFESDGMEVGVRLRSVIYDAIVTLNAFYGRDNDVVRRVVGGPAGPPPISDFDGRMILRLQSESYYPVLKYVGATFTRDFPALSSSALGGVAPTWRAEVMYIDDFTNGTSLQTFEESDEIRWMVGFDWKIKLNFLNPENSFFISPQFYHRHIVDYAKDIPGIKYTLTDYSGTIKKDNYTTSIMINTFYMNNKLQPMVFWLRDYTGDSDLFKAQISWEPDYKWKYTVGAMFLNGGKTGVNFEPLKHKDQAYITVQYRF